MTEDFIDPGQIRGYHAHIYYDPAATKEIAARLREEIGRRFTGRSATGMTSRSGHIPLRCTRSPSRSRNSRGWSHG